MEELKELCVWNLISPVCIHRMCANNLNCVTYSFLIYWSCWKASGQKAPFRYVVAKFSYVCNTSKWVFEMQSALIVHKMLTISIFVFSSNCKRAWAMMKKTRNPSWAPYSKSSRNFLCSRASCTIYRRPDIRKNSMRSYICGPNAWRWSKKKFSGICSVAIRYWCECHYVMEWIIAI